MIRTQITLDRELRNRARQRASQLGISLAEYIRRLLVQDLTAPRHNTDPSAVFNLGDSGGSDIARDKDALVADAVAAGEGVPDELVVREAPIREEESDDG